MLNEWERRRLEEIEHDLATDPTFLRAIEGPTPRWPRLARMRSTFYPGGFLVVATTSMIVTTGRSLMPAMTGLGVVLVLVYALVWVLAVLDRRGPGSPP